MTDIDTQFLRSLFDEEGSLHTAGRTALYRLYGPQGLLYVGISTCPLTRIRTHLQQQPWGPHVIGIRIDYPHDAHTAEREAVHTERPLHNVMFNGQAPPPPPDRAARLRAELAAQRRRLDELQAAVPQSTAHLRLILRGITAAQTKVAKLTREAEEAERAQEPPGRGAGRTKP
ncbi:GIY-YIG nuclease family protein [Streptomyces pseudovenezuelae]|uniref:GIY-YIG nuclease family protein n=1 Tax=Streptomyces pseudovenezuelae TaxID=67350 RepID=UPI0036EBB625